MRTLIFTISSILITTSTYAGVVSWFSGNEVNGDKLKIIEDKLMDVSSAESIPELMRDRVKVFYDGVSSSDRNLEVMINTIRAAKDYEFQTQLWAQLAKKHNISVDDINFEAYKAEVAELKQVVVDILAQKYFDLGNKYTKQAEQLRTKKFIDKYAAAAQSYAVIANELPESRICTKNLLNCADYIDAHWVDSETGIKKSGLDFSVSKFGSGDYTQILITKLAMDTQNSELADKYFPVIVENSESPFREIAKRWFKIAHPDSVEELQKQQSPGATGITAQIASRLQNREIKEAFEDFFAFTCRFTAKDREAKEINCDALFPQAALELSNIGEYAELESKLLSYVNEEHLTDEQLKLLNLIQKIYETNLQIPAHVNGRTILPTWIRVNYLLIAHAVYNEKKPSKALKLFESNHLGHNPALPDAFYQRSKSLMKSLGLIER